MRIPVRRPSPALVISCVALAIALGGTSYATVLSTEEQRRPGAAEDCSGHEQEDRQQRGQLGQGSEWHARQGRLQGRLAPSRSRRPRRPRRSGWSCRAAGLSGVERLETTSANTSTTSKSVFLACPTGKRLIGGGARVTGGSPRVAILTSYPDNDNIWRASAAETTGTVANWTLTVYSICATTS